MHPNISITKPGYHKGVYDADLALADLKNFLPDEAVLIPLKPATKRPMYPKWQCTTRQSMNLVLDSNILDKNAGIGLICGSTSRGLCFIDIDNEMLAGDFCKQLPQLQYGSKIFGNRGYKILVRVPEDVRGFALKSESGARFGELLGNRQQGVVAGIHPETKEGYRWLWNGFIPEISLDMLRRVSNSKV